MMRSPDSDNPRPSSHEALWACTVPQWEKQFCSTVGSIPWRKFLEMKSFVYLYDNIINWDDSAGEQAFNDAKSRFRAKINGLPCDDGASLSLPDPEVYIDEVDWDSPVDPELLLDLETGPAPTPPPSEPSQDENSVPLTKALLTRQSFSCSGWGDPEECIEKRPGGVDDAWGRSYRDCGNAALKGGNGRWGHSFDTRNNAAVPATGWYNSRYKASRFPSNGPHYGNRGANLRDWRRAGNLGFEKHGLRQWAMKS